MAFPTTLPSFSDTDAAETLVNAGGGTGLSGFLDALAVDVTALGTKIGTGADTPVLNDVMVGTGTGTSGWSASLSGLTIAAPVLSGTVTGTYTLGGTPSMSGATLTAPVIATSLDMNGTELILDADADTSITADTDDQIDFKLSGADDFRMTANTFTVLSGSTLSIPSGGILTVASGGTLNVDAITETTGANGVSIDGLSIKDSKLVTSNSVITANITNAAVTADKLGTGAATNSVATSQTTTSSSYTDLATAGPAVTVTVGANGLLLVVISCISSNSVGGNRNKMSYALSGANTLAASDGHSWITNAADA